MTVAAADPGPHHLAVSTITRPHPEAVVPTRPEPTRMTAPRTRVHPVRSRPRWRWTHGTPGRIRLLAAGAAVATVAVAVLLVLEVGRVQRELDAIGHAAGPEVVASADLYFALNDMDAQIANVLL